MIIIDETNTFSDKHKLVLSNFVETDLLSNSIAIKMLHKIVIGERPDSDCDGSWRCRIVDSQIRCVIFLNAHFTSQLASQYDKIEQFKKVLAHEYGHHWTLAHLIANHNFNYDQQRLPKIYYDLRGLDTSMCSARYVDDSYSLP